MTGFAQMYDIFFTYTCVWGSASIHNLRTVAPRYGDLLALLVYRTLHRLLSSPHCAAFLSSCRTSWLSHRLSPSSHCAALSLSCLVASAGCHIASCCPLIASPSRQLVAPACCRIASPRPLFVPCAALSSSRRAGWLLLRLSTRHPLVVSSSHCATSRCLVAPAGCHVTISCRLLVALPSRPLIVLAGCCVACACAALSSSCCSPSPTPSNTVKCCCRQTPPPPPPLNAVSIFYPPPLPQLPSIATVK